MSTPRLMLIQTAASLHTAQPEHPHLLLRDSESGLPSLRASTLLGALRKAVRDRLYPRYAEAADWKSAANEDPDLIRLFGRKDPAQKGQISATQATLFCLPVRSLQGGFSWVTSVQSLSKLSAHAPELVAALSPMPHLERSAVFCDESHRCLLGGEHLLLEELCLQRQGPAEAIFAALQTLFAETPLATELKQRLVIVSEQIFQHFTHYAMVPEAYQDPKTGRHSYLEALPPHSCLYSILNLSPSQETEPESAQADWQEMMPKVLYLGSHRNTGHGLCQISLLPVKEVLHV